MEKLKMDEMAIKKNSLIKSKTFWIIAIIIFLSLGYFMGKFDNIPEGIDADFYKESVYVFEKYNELIDNGETSNNGFIPNDEGVKEWLATNTINYSMNPNDYTEKESRIIVLFNTIRENLKMLQQLGEGDGFINQVLEARIELASILELDAEFPRKNVANKLTDTNRTNTQEESTVIDEAITDSKSVGQGYDKENASDNPGDVNATNEYGVTKLAKASGEGNIDLVKELLSQGADPNLYKGMGEPALLWAVRSNQDNIVKILLDAGANPNFKSKEGVTPLMIAKENGANVILIYLEEYGATE